MNIDELRKRVSATNLQCFVKLYGYDPFVALGDGDVIWFNRTRPLPLRSTTLYAAALGAVGPLTLRDVLTIWPLWLRELIAASLGAAAGFAVAYIRRGNGLGIGVNEITLRKGSVLTTRASSSVALIAPLISLLPDAMRMGSNWPGLRLYSDDGSIFEIRSLEAYESEIAYVLLSGICGRALAMRPNGQVDIGAELSGAVPQPSTLTAIGSATSIYGKLAVKLTVGSIIAAAAGVVLGYAWMYGSLSHNASRGNGQSEPMIMAMVFIFGSLVMGNQALTVRRRRNEFVSTVTDAKAGNTIALQAMRSDPEPVREDVLVLALRVPIIAKFLVIVALLTFFIPVVGSLTSFIAIQASKGYSRGWRKISVTCFCLSFVAIIVSLILFYFVYIR